MFIFIFLYCFLRCFCFLCTVLSSTNNSKTNLFEVLIGSPQVLPLQARVDLGVMAMNKYSTLLRSLKLEHHHQIWFSAIPRTPLFEECFNSIQRIQSAYSNPSLQKIEVVVSIYHARLKTVHNIFNWLWSQLLDRHFFPMPVVTSHSHIVLATPTNTKSSFLGSSEHYSFNKYYWPRMWVRSTGPQVENEILSLRLVSTNSFKIGI